MDVAIPEPALLRLVAGFLRERGLHSAAAEVLKQADDVLKRASAPPVDQLLLAGDWAAVEAALRQAAAGDPPTLSALLWHVRRQRFLEHCHAEAASPARGSGDAVASLVAQLGGLEAIAPSPAAFHALAYTLALPSVVQHPDFAGWSPLMGRADCLAAIQAAAAKAGLPVAPPSPGELPGHVDDASLQLPPPGQLVALLTQAARAQAAASGVRGPDDQAPLVFDPCAPVDVRAATGAPVQPPPLHAAPSRGSAPASRRPSTALPLPVTPPRVLLSTPADGDARAPPPAAAAAAARPSSAASSQSSSSSSAAAAASVSYGHSSGAYHRKNVSSIVLGDDGGAAFKDAVAAVAAGSPGRGAAARAAAAAAARDAAALPAAGLYGQQRPHAAAVDEAPVPAPRRGSTASSAPQPPPQPVAAAVAVGSVSLTFSPPRARPRRAAPVQPPAPAPAADALATDVAPTAAPRRPSQVTAYLLSDSHHRDAAAAAAAAAEAAEAATRAAQPVPHSVAPRIARPHRALPRPSSAASASSVWWSIPFDGPPQELPEPPAPAAPLSREEGQPGHAQAGVDDGTSTEQDQRSAVQQQQQQQRSPPAHANSDGPWDADEQASAPVPPQEWFGNGGGASSPGEMQPAVSDTEPLPTLADDNEGAGGEATDDAGLADTEPGVAAPSPTAAAGASDGADGGAGGLLSLSQLAWMEGEVQQEVEQRMTEAVDEQQLAAGEGVVGDAGGDDEEAAPPAEEHGAPDAVVFTETSQGGASPTSGAPLEAPTGAEPDAAAQHGSAEGTGGDAAAAPAPTSEGVPVSDAADAEPPRAEDEVAALPPPPVELAPLHLTVTPLAAYADAQPIRAVAWCSGQPHGDDPLLLVGTNSRSLKALHTGAALAGVAPAAPGALPVSTAALSALHLGSVYAIAACGDSADFGGGVLVATCSNDTTVKVVRLTTTTTSSAPDAAAGATHALTTLATLQPSLSTLRDLCWLPVGGGGGGGPHAEPPRRLLLACAGGGDFSVKVFDLTAVASSDPAQLPSTAVVAVLSGHAGVVHSLRALPALGPGTLAAASADGTLCVWDASAAADGGAVLVAYWDLGGALAAGQTSGQLAGAPAAAGALLADELHSLAVLPAAAYGGGVVAVGTAAGRVAVVDVRTGTLLAAARVHAGEVRSVHAATVAAGGRDGAARRTLLLSASFDATVAVSELVPALAGATCDLREVARVRHEDKALCGRWFNVDVDLPALLLPAHFATSGADRRAVVWRLEEA